MILRARGGNVGARGQKDVIQVEPRSLEFLEQLLELEDQIEPSLKVIHLLLVPFDELRADEEVQADHALIDLLLDGLKGADAESIPRSFVVDHIEVEPVPFGLQPVELRLNLLLLLGFDGDHHQLVLEPGHIEVNQLTQREVLLLQRKIVISDDVLDLDPVDLLNELVAKGLDDRHRVPELPDDLLQPDNRQLPELGVPRLLRWRLVLIEVLSHAPLALEGSLGHRRACFADVLDRDRVQAGEGHRSPGGGAPCPRPEGRPELLPDLDQLLGYLDLAERVHSLHLQGPLVVLDVVFILLQDVELDLERAELFQHVLGIGARISAVDVGEVVFPDFLQEGLRPGDEVRDLLLRDGLHLVFISHGLVLDIIYDGGEHTGHLVGLIDTDGVDVLPGEHALDVAQDRKELVRELQPLLVIVEDFLDLVHHLDLTHKLLDVLRREVQAPDVDLEPCLHLADPVLELPRQIFLEQVDVMLGASAQLRFNIVEVEHDQAQILLLWNEVLVGVLLGEEPVQEEGNNIGRVLQLGVLYVLKGDPVVLPSRKEEGIELNQLPLDFRDAHLDDLSDLVV